MNTNEVSQQYQPTDIQEISLKDIILFLWYNKLVIAIVTALFSIVSVVYSLRINPTYQSTAKLITRTSNNSDGGLSQVAMLAGISLGTKTNTDPSRYLSEVLQNWDFLQKILNKRWYMKDVGDSVSLEQIWKIPYDTTLKDWQYLYESQKINRLRSGSYISLSTNKKLDLLTLKTTFQTPELAFQINQFILTLIAEYMRESFRFQAQEKRRFIEQRIDEVFKDLEESENRLVEFKERNLNTSAPKVFLEEQRLQRNVMLNQELYLQLKKQYEIARIEEKNDQPLIEILQKPEMPIVRSAPNRREIVLMGLSIGFFVSLFLAISWHWYKKNFK